jgi:hypothetical protein
MSIFQQVFGGGFDSNSVEPPDSFDVLPPGDYAVVIEKAEVKTTKKGDGHYLEICTQITEGPAVKRKLWSRFNIDNPSEVAQRIGQSQLAGLCKATGIAVIRDESELLGKTCIARVKVKDDSNEVRAWKAVVGTTPPPSFAPPTTAPVTPPYQAPTQATEHTASMPGPTPTTTAGAKPPWAR